MNPQTIGTFTIKPVPDVADAHVRELSALAFSDLADIIEQHKDVQGRAAQTRVLAEIVLRGACTAEGARLFAGVDQVLEEPFARLKTLADAVLQVNGLTADGEGLDLGE